MRVQEFYQWKLPTLDDEGDPIWITPRSNPWEHEFPIDFVFETEEEARQFLKDWEIDPEECEEWVLVKVREEKVGEAV